MKIVCISDTHGKFPRKLPKGDVLVVAGDYCPNFSLHKGSDAVRQGIWLEFEGFSALSRLADVFAHVVFVPGNHDRVFELEGSKCRDLFSQVDNVHLLVNQSVKLDGKKFYGSPYSSWFFGEHWAFNLPDLEKEGNEDKVRAIWDNIPLDVDVLITHGPPLNVLDRTREGLNVGCPILGARVNKIKPKAHIFGHIHESSGEVEALGIKYVNAAYLDRDYHAGFEIKMVEI